MGACLVSQPNNTSIRCSSTAFSVSHVLGQATTLVGPSNSARYQPLSAELQASTSSTSPSNTPKPLWVTYRTLTFSTSSESSRLVGSGTTHSHGNGPDSASPAAAGVANVTASEAAQPCTISQPKATSIFPSRSWLMESHVWGHAKTRAGSLESSKCHPPGSHSARLGT